MSSAVREVGGGVPGLDEVLYGGVPGRNAVLAPRGPGTGNSITAKQFLHYGLKSGEPGVFVTLEEHPVIVRRDSTIRIEPSLKSEVKRMSNAAKYVREEEEEV